MHERMIKCLLLVVLCFVVYLFLLIYVNKSSLVINAESVKSPLPTEILEHEIVFWGHQCYAQMAVHTGLEVSIDSF